MPRTAEPPPLAPQAPLPTPSARGRSHVDAHDNELPLDALTPGQLNPRQRSTPERDQDLLASIRAHGIIQPLVVRPTGRVVQGPQQMSFAEHEIVCGERRFRAATAAGLTSVPVRVFELTDPEAIELGLIENIQREGLHPIEEAESYQRWLQLDRAYTVEALALKCGKSIRDVENRLRLLRLIGDAREAYFANAITATHADRLAKLALDQQLPALQACFSPLLVKTETLEQSGSKATGINAVALLIGNGAWADLAPGLNPISVLDQWIETFAKADLSTPEVQQQLGITLETRPTMELDAASGPDDDEDDIPEPGQVIELSRLGGQDLTAKDAKAMGVLRQDDWKQILEGRKACPNTVKGAIVHGGPLELVMACPRSTRCTTHWPKPKVASSTSTESEKQKRLDAEAAAERERTAWTLDKPIALKTLGRQLLKRQRSIVDVLTDYIGANTVARVKAEFGIALTPKTAAAVLAAFRIGSHSRAGFLEDAKRAGGDLRALTREVKAAALKRAAAVETSIAATTNGKPTKDRAFAGRVRKELVKLGVPRRATGKRGRATGTGPRPKARSARKGA